MQEFWNAEFWMPLSSSHESLNIPWVPLTWVKPTTHDSCSTVSSTQILGGNSNDLDASVKGLHFPCSRNTKAAAFQAKRTSRNIIFWKWHVPYAWAAAEHAHNIVPRVRRPEACSFFLDPVDLADYQVTWKTIFLGLDALFTNGESLLRNLVFDW